MPPVVPFIPLIVAAASAVQQADTARKAQHAGEQQTAFAEQGKQAALKQEGILKKNRQRAAGASNAARGFIGDANDPNNILGNIISQINTGSAANSSLINVRGNAGVAAGQNTAQAGKDAMTGAYIQGAKALTPFISPSPAQTTTTTTPNTGFVTSASNPYGIDFATPQINVKPLA